MTEFNDFENVYVIIGISTPRTARYIGTNARDQKLFEPLRKDFKQFKNGSKLIFLNNFKVADIKIQNKKVIVAI